MVVVEGVEAIFGDGGVEYSVLWAIAFPDCHPANGNRDRNPVKCGDLYLLLPENYVLYLQPIGSKFCFC
jgi:hypothetical protein